jgi:hypothetical protein
VRESRPIDEVQRALVPWRHQCAKLGQAGTLRAGGESSRPRHCLSRCGLQHSHHRCDDDRRSMTTAETAHSPRHGPSARVIGASGGDRGQPAAAPRRDTVGHFSRLLSPRRARTGRPGGRVGASPRHTRRRRRARGHCHFRGTALPSLTHSARLSRRATRAGRRRSNNGRRRRTFDRSAASVPGLRWAESGRGRPPVTCAAGRERQGSRPAGEYARTLRTGAHSACACGRI